jgi:hypothetical protein
MTHSTPTKNATSQRVNVRLQKNHTHAGAKYGAGSLLTVDVVSADWLIQQGIAKPEKTISTEAAAVTASDKKKPA